MKFQNAKVEGNTITLTKEELTEARDHYLKEATNKMKACDDYVASYYSGKADMLGDMLKIFEPIDFV